MKLVIIAPGSRGDVQPYIALGCGLQEAGHEVQLVSNAGFQVLAESYGLPFLPAALNIQDDIQSDESSKALESGRLLKSLRLLARMARKGAGSVAELGYEACHGADAVIAGFTGLFPAMSIAEKRSIQLIQAYNVPFTPTREFPGVGLPHVPFALNRLSHCLTRQIIWMTCRSMANRARQEVLGLPSAPLFWPSKDKALNQGPIVYSLSPQAIPRPADWSEHIAMSGYWFLDEPDGWTPSTALSDFLGAGPPPVYIGFGSMSNSKSEETASLVLQALADTEQRGIMYSGWGGLSKDDVPDTVLMVDAVPHAWLFPRMAAVVHHGGAGTTAAGLRSGVPSIVIPFHGDQPFWGCQVARLEVGPHPVPRKKLTACRLAQAIEQAVTDKDMRTKASDLGQKIQAEDGIARAIDFIERCR